MMMADVFRATCRCGAWPAMNACCVLLAGTFVAAAQPSDGSTRYGEPAEIAQLKDREIRESSGLAPCRGIPGTYWTHNDSGDEPRIFLVDRDGATLSAVRITDVDLDDWEDMCSFQLDNVNYLLIGDVGDNGKRREEIHLYLVREPAASQLLKHETLRVTAAAKIRVKYEGGPLDCESLAIDARQRKILLASKQVLTCSIFEFPFPQPDDHSVVKAARAARVPIPLVTSMDISDDSLRCVLLTYMGAFLYTRTHAESWKTAFSREPVRIKLPKQKQPEAICFGLGNWSLVVSSEGVHEPIWRIPAN